MELGGRRAVYDLMGMKAPTTKGPPPRKEAPKIVIDRTGANDKARYSGLKMGLGMDDEAMAEALAKASQKAKEGKGLRPKLMEETYEQPFAGKALIAKLRMFILVKCVECRHQFVSNLILFFRNRRLFACFFVLSGLLVVFPLYRKEKCGTETDS